MIASMDVARGAAGGVVPGSAGWAEHPDSHSHVTSAPGSREGSQTSGRGVSQEQRSATSHTWAYLSVLITRTVKTRSGTQSWSLGIIAELPQGLHPKQTVGWRMAGDRRESPCCGPGCHQGVSPEATPFSLSRSVPGLLATTHCHLGDRGSRGFPLLGAGIMVGLRQGAIWGTGAEEGRVEEDGGGVQTKSSHLGLGIGTLGS